MSIIEISTIDQFNNYIIELQSNKSKAVITYFYSNTCLSCKYIIKPLIVKLAKQYNIFTFIQIDIDNQNLIELLPKYHIAYVPAVTILRFEHNMIKVDLTLGTNIRNIIESKIENIKLNQL